MIVRFVFVVLLSYPFSLKRQSGLWFILVLLDIVVFRTLPYHLVAFACSAAFIGIPVDLIVYVSNFFPALSIFCFISVLVLFILLYWCQYVYSFFFCCCLYLIIFTFNSFLYSLTLLFFLLFILYFIDFCPIYFL